MAICLMFARGTRADLRTMKGVAMKYGLMTAGLLALAGSALAQPQYGYYTGTAKTVVYDNELKKAVKSTAAIQIVIDGGGNCYLTSGSTTVGGTGFAGSSHGFYSFAGGPVVGSLTMHWDSKGNVKGSYRFGAAIGGSGVSSEATYTVQYAGVL